MKKVKSRLYFAHPINTYGTDLERKLLALIAAEFPGCEIVNPSDQVHVDKVAELKKDDPKANVMPYFEELAASCDKLVALPFGDGMWGAGVWLEAQKMIEKCDRVWVINPANNGVMLLPTVSEMLKLSVDETRARIRNPDGTTKPYV